MMMINIKFLKITVFRATSLFIAMMKEAVRTSETSVNFYEFPEDYLHTFLRKKPELSHGTRRSICGPLVHTSIASHS
jgi:hypothetical protein